MRQEEHGYRINWKNQFWKNWAYGPFRVAGHKWTLQLIENTKDITKLLW